MSDPFIVIHWRGFRLAASGRLAVTAVITGIALLGLCFAIWVVW
jgi:hypothetical protein